MQAMSNKLATGYTESYTSRGESIGELVINLDVERVSLGVRDMLGEYVLNWLYRDSLN